MTKYYQSEPYQLAKRRSISFQNVAALKLTERLVSPDHFPAQSVQQHKAEAEKLTPVAFCSTTRFLSRHFELKPDKKQS